MQITISWGWYGGVAAFAALLALGGACVRCWPQITAVWQRLRGTDPAAQFDTVLAALVQRVANGHDARTLRRNLLAFISEFSHADSASLLLCDRTNGKFVMGEVYGVAPESFRVGEITAFLEALRTLHRTVTRRDFVENSAFAELKTLGLHYCIQFHAEACVPCFVGDELIAVVNLGPRVQQQSYDGLLCGRLDRLAMQCALLLQNAHFLEIVQHHEREVTKVTELRRHFLSNISHELRTPLTTVIGLTEHLLEHRMTTTPDEWQQYLQMIQQSGQRLLKTVTSLVDLAKLESGREMLEVRRVSLGRLLGQVVKSLPATEKIDVALGEQIPPVYGDEAWLQCLLHHLLDNATKFAPRGRIWVDAARAGEMLRVGVHDSGPGIRPEHHEQIFNGFVQAENGAARPYEGTGVGLAISRRVVELHGGRMWLQSGYGNGSHFFFTLPLKPA